MIKLTLILNCNPLTDFYLLIVSAGLAKADFAISEKLARATHGVFSLILISRPFLSSIYNISAYVHPILR